jgi:TPR repeat protein
MNAIMRQWVVFLTLVSLILLCSSKSVFSSHRINDFKSIADQGCVYSQYNLGVIYYGGIGVPPDLEEALSWFRKVAEQDYVDAQVAMAGMYYLGQGVPQDYSEAARWARKAADQNDAEAPE